MLSRKTGVESLTKTKQKCIVTNACHPDTHLKTRKVLLEHEAGKEGYS
jgi:hypothetical protein